MMSLKTIPGSGKSGTSRILAARSIVPSRHAAQLYAVRARRGAGTGPGSARRASAARRAPPAGARGSAPAGRRDHLLEQRGLAFGRGAERAQVPRRQPEARQLGARRGDVGVAFRVAPRPRPARAARSPRARARSRASTPDRSQSSSSVDLVLALAERGRPAALALAAPATTAPGGSRAAAGTRRAAAAGSSRSRSTSSSRTAGSRPGCAAASAAPGPRGSGSSRSRCPGTRRCEPPAHRADREQRWRAGAASRGHLRRNVIRYLPICTSSPSSSPALLDPLAVHEGAVQAALVLDREAAVLAMSTAWRRETVTSSRKMSQSGERPIVVRSPCGWKCLARAAAARADDERRPVDAELRRELGLLADLLGGERLRRLAAASALREQRAAARAVVRRLRVLEAALRAVDVRIESVRRAAPPCRRGSRSAGRRRPARARSPRPSSAAARRAPRGGCRSCPCRMRRRYETSFSSLRRAPGSGPSAPRRRALRDRGAIPLALSVEGAVQYSEAAGPEGSTSA